MSIAEKLITIAENEPKVFEAGKKSEYDHFWDTYQQNGTRTVYDYDFAGSGWNKETFKPKYNIHPTSLYFAFRAAKGLSVDFVEYFKKLGVSFDTSKCTSFEYFLYNSGVTRLGKLDLSKATGVTGCLTYAYDLETIDELIPPSTDLSLSNVLGSCTKLKNLTLSGELKSDGFNMQKSPLTHESLMSIINALKDYSGTSTWKTITLGADNIAKLSADELAIMTSKQWNYI